MINLTRSSLLDAPQKESEGVNGAVHWLAETVVNPVINAALIDPYDTVSHALQDVSRKRIGLGEIKPLNVKKSEPYSTDWFVSSAMGGVGSLVPFVLAGKVTGSVMRRSSSLLGLEGKAASVLASNRLAQISGAGIYSALKRPQEGETRLGNAIGTMGAFAIFDAGNSLAGLKMFNKSGTLAFSARSALRIGTGFLGGASQAELSSLVAQQKLANNDVVLQSAVAGASLNFAIGTVHDIAAGGKNNNSSSAGARVAETKAGEGKNVVYIIVDSGFSPASLPPRQNILRTWDPTGEGVFKDPLNHGSVVLSKLRDGDPSAKFILIKAYDGNNNLATTKFEQGQIAQPGWTEAYLDAVALAKQHKLPSIANCSFGEFSHAMDGTGWESFQLSHATGKGKPGHIVVAAAGPGNGAARHASGTVEAGKSGEVHISQNGEAAFNLWMAKDAPRDWHLSVYEGGRKIHSVDGSRLEANFWNNRQQITFRSHIERAATSFVLSRTGADPRPLPFDFFVQEGRAAFLNHINPELISEPAIFPNVVAVGIKDLSYSPNQGSLGNKPNVLLPGEGPVSFRTPEVTLAIGKLLKENPNLDATQVQTILGKFPLGK